MDYTIKKICSKLKHTETGWISTPPSLLWATAPCFSDSPCPAPISPLASSSSWRPLWLQDGSSTTAMRKLIHTASQNHQSKVLSSVLMNQPKLYC